MSRYPRYEKSKADSEHGPQGHLKRGGGNQELLKQVGRVGGRDLLDGRQREDKRTNENEKAGQRGGEPPAAALDRDELRDPPGGQQRRERAGDQDQVELRACLLYTSPSPRDRS